MNLSNLRNLSFKAKFSIVSAIFLVFGLFGAVMVSQQQQEVRSRAAGTGGTGNCATLNTSTDELVADDCTIPGGLNYGIRGNRNTIQGGLGGWPANIFGDGNLIMGGMNGTINGNGNEICGGLGGSINGNNNIIHGGINGTDNGTGNIINSGGTCGIIRQPTVTPTTIPTPTPTPNPTSTPTPTPIPTSVPFTPTPTLPPLNACSAQFAVFRPSTGQWLVQGGATVSFGLNSDIPVPGDYNGDGRNEFAVFRPGVGQWHFQQNGTSVSWGVNGDIPVPADYNGDRKTDVAVFRPSTGQWLVKDGVTASWGLSSDVPVPADYNGDGKDEFAVFRPSTGQWLVQGGATVSFGLNSDIPVPGDYNGDGRNEFAVFRPSTGQWLVKDGVTASWGINGDKPLPADYDGDGRNEFAVFRPSTGQWLVKDGVTTSWGLSSDVPVPAKYSANLVCPRPTVPPVTVTPTVTIGDTVFSLNLLLHGIGKGGDSANPNGGGNANPLHPQRQVVVEVYNTQNQLVMTKTGTVNFIPTTGNFTGSVNMGKALVSGSYMVKVKSTQFLRRIIPGIQSIIAGALNQLPQTTLINGDIDGSNSLTILDYNILIGCYSDFLPAVSCTPENKLRADLGDDGKVNQFDYNLFLRELTNIQGQ